MSNKILIKRSGTANSVPVAGDLSLGELAINYNDGNLFYKDGGGTVRTLVSTQFVSVVGNVTGGNINTAGMVSTTGNIIGGNIIVTSLTSTRVPYVGANDQLLDTTNFVWDNPNQVLKVGAGGTEIGGDAGFGYLSTTTVSAGGNVTGGNLKTGGLISATGNVSGNYILGNGALLTGVITSVANINLGTSNVTVVSSGGNITVGVGGTSNVAVFATTGEYVTGVISASGNITGGNLITTAAVSAASVSASGTITGGNIVASVAVSAASVSATGNITGGNIVTSGASGNITGANVISGTTLSATGNITGGNIVTAAAVSAASVSASGNVTGGNIVSAAAVSGVSVVASGNVTGGNIVTAAAVSAGSVSSSGNVTGGNLITAAAVSAASVSASGNVTGGNVNTNTIVGTGTTIISSGAINLSATGNIVVYDRYINNLADPVQNQDAATKYYVDSVAQGLHIHDSANLASTQDLATYTGATVTYNNGASGVGATLSLVGNTLTSLDGTTLVGATASTRLLIKNQANAVQNGMYNYTSSSLLTRTTDFDTNAEAAGGDFLFVTTGATQADTGWVQTTDNPTLGTDPLYFTQFSGAGTYSANTAAGLVLNGSVFSAKTDGITTAFDGTGNIIVKASAALTTPNIGAATGTSLSVTGNITGGNLNAAGLSLSGNVVSAVNTTANITGGNIISLAAFSGVSVVATGNVSGANINGTTGVYSAGVQVLTINDTVDGGTY